MTFDTKHVITDRNSGESSYLRRFRTDGIVILLSAAVFLGCAFPPPHLMDDVDAVQALIGRNMLISGDWVTARLNGVAYLEKAPLHYWMIAAAFRFLGIHDWAARLPFMLAAIALCWVTLRFGRWAFGADAGLYAGIALSTCAGLFLFTRILIPDATLTLTITIANWCFLRALEPGEARQRLWTTCWAISIAAGLLLKGLIAIVFPVGTAFVYLTITRQLFSRQTWRKLHPASTLAIITVIGAPWHVLATLRSPPLFDFTMHSAPGEYHGFFWFYFFNEHLFRFLNLRYPRDYNTVPRLWFWLLHLVWLFPWSVYIPAALRFGTKPMDRAGRTGLFAFCWIGLVLSFFSFSTTQEYYSMPVYPALALLIGAGMTTKDKWVKRGTATVAGVCILALIAITGLVWTVWNLPTPSDISAALTQNPDLYTLSLGHMGDLTVRSFAYLRLPLIIAGFAMLIGLTGILRYRRDRSRTFMAIAVMMVIFLHAARLAMIAFDPYLGSKPLAESLISAPHGKLIAANPYYAFSSVYFYSGQPVLLWNGRVDNLEYGSYAPNAPDIFINDSQFQKFWESSDRYYLLAFDDDLQRIQNLTVPSSVHVIAKSGGKLLLTNQPL